MSATETGKTAKYRETYGEPEIDRSNRKSHDRTSVFVSPRIVSVL